MKKPSMDKEKLEDLERPELEEDFSLATVKLKKIRIEPHFYFMLTVSRTDRWKNGVRLSKYIKLCV